MTISVNSTACCLKYRLSRGSCCGKLWPHHLLLRGHHRWARHHGSSSCTRLWVTQRHSKRHTHACTHTHTYTLTHSYHAKRWRGSHDRTDPERRSLRGVGGMGGGGLAPNHTEQDNTWTKWLWHTIGSLHTLGWWLLVWWCRVLWSMCMNMFSSIKRNKEGSGCQAKQVWSSKARINLNLKL